MRILIVTPLYPPDLGRLATYSKELARHLSKTHQVTLVTYANIPEELPGVEIICISKSLPLATRLIEFSQAVRRAAKKADVIYVGDGASVGLPSWIATRFQRIPFIRFVMSDEAWERATQSKTNILSEEAFMKLPPATLKDAWVRRFQQFILKRADGIFVSSQTRKAALLETQRLVESRIHVGTYPVSAADILPFEPEPSKTRLLVTSPLMKSSRVDEVLQAVAHLSPSYPALELIVAGYGPEQGFLQDLAHTLGIADRVRFLGYTSHAEIEYWMRSSSHLILNHESFHRPDEIYLAYRARLPVIASHVPAHQELIQNGESGLLTPLGKTDDLTRAIQILLEDDVLRNKLIEGGARLFEAHATWTAHLEELTKCFSAVSVK